MLPPVHVHHTGQQLEGVEGDADGQGDVFDKFGHFPEDAAHQPGILKVADEGNVDDRGGGHPQPLPFAFRGFHPQGAEPGHQGHEHEKQDIFRLAPGVEDQGKDQQHRILRPLGSAQAVPQQGQGKEAV